MKKNKIIFSKNEFTEELLPHSRKEQFKFIFKTRKSLLFSLGLLLLLFSLPLIVSTGFKGSFIINYINSVSTIDMETIEMLLFNNFIFTVVNVICFLIVTIGLSGILYIIRKVIFGEPVFFWKDFALGIKKNWLSFTLTSLFLGMIAILNAYLLRLAGLQTFTEVLLGVYIIIVIPLFVNVYFYKNIYSSNLKETLLNTSRIFLLNNVKGILLSLGLIVIPSVIFILIDYLLIAFPLAIVILILYFLFFVPFYLMIMGLFYSSIFDECINKNNFHSIYRKGLYTSDKINDEE